MSDNRTTELPMEHFRAALEKRGIEYETNDDECAYGEPRCTVFKAHIGGDRETDTVIVGVKDWYFDGKLMPWLDVEFHNVLTPEQAIAATLGNELNPDGLPVIVRCRDCKFGVDGGKYCAEGCADSWDWRNVEPDGYCAWAERADNFTTCKCGEDIEISWRESVTCPSCGRVITE